MKKYRISYFKNVSKAKIFFKNWIEQLEDLNACKYENIEVTTELGKTQIWGYNTVNYNAETVVIFPGARTTSLIWDLDNGLAPLKEKYKIYLIETNGLPNLSDGATPNIKSKEYGIWASKVFEELNIEKAYIIGASFGGLIAAKLAITNPEKIKAIFMLNPGCLQPFSLKWKNLYYNLLPIIWPTEKNVRIFLNKAIFKKKHHELSKVSEQMLVEYEILALKEFKDNTQKPYFMDKELKCCKSEVHLIVGDKDLLFPFEKSVFNAKKLLPNLKNIKVFSDVGHGIETFQPAIKYIAQTIESNHDTITN